MEDLETDCWWADIEFYEVAANCGEGDFSVVLCRSAVSCEMPLRF